MHIYSYIKAFSDVAENVRAQERQINNTGRFIEFEFIPEESINAILESGNISQETVDELYEELEDKAIVMAKLDYYRTMEHFKQILAKNIEEGENITDFIRRVGEDELTSTLGIGKDPWYANVVYRTNSALAYSAGKWKSIQENPQITMLEFVSVADNRTTDTCLERNGTTLPKENEFWRSNTPPLHFQCRSDLVEYTQAFVDAFNIEEFESPNIETPAEGFGGVEGYENNDWLKPTKKMKEDLGFYE